MSLLSEWLSLTKMTGPRGSWATLRCLWTCSAVIVDRMWCRYRKSTTSALVSIVSVVLFCCLHQYNFHFCKNVYLIFLLRAQSKWVFLLSEYIGYQLKSSLCVGYNTTCRLHNRLFETSAKEGRNTRQVHFPGTGGKSNKFTITCRVFLPCHVPSRSFTSGRKGKCVGSGCASKNCPCIASPV